MEHFGHQSDHGSQYADCANIQDDETFWATRAAELRTLFQQWDCIQLSNEVFGVRLQTLLGHRVDVSSPESEFIRLTNKHRDARNLKFAAFMQALRLDARSTSLTRGRLEETQTQFRVPAGAMSSYEPSDAGCSEGGLSHSAGRATQQTSDTASNYSGRRHYQPYAVSSGVLPYRQQPGDWTAAPLQTIEERRRMAPGHEASTPRQEAATHLPGGLLFHGGENADSPQFHGGNRFNSGDSPNHDGRIHLGSITDDGQSEYGGSVAASVADSQRELFAARNVAGHGNILTWGEGSSRPLTPQKARGGRQMAVDDRGRPAAYKTSGIFHGMGERG